MSKYKFRTKPYAHQKAALKRLLKQGYGGALLMEPRTGKGLVHGTPVVTPSGVVPIEALREGDQAVGRNGLPTTITGVFPRGELDVYRVTFNDGTTVTVDGEHLWAARTHMQERHGKDYEVVQTIDLFNDERLAKRRWEIPMCEPVQWPECELPIDPYTLGVLIGDGGLHKSAHFSTDADTIAEVARRSPLGKITVVDESSGHSYASVLGGTSPLQAMGLIGTRAETKFIPDEYLYTSISQRLDLLRGLMDTDGSLSIRDNLVSVGFGSTSEKLRDQVAFLVESLGGQARKTIKAEPKYQGGRVGQPYYRLKINLPINPFLTRQGWVPREKFLPKRIIRSIEHVGTAPVTCISVDAEDQLFLTDHFIVTHNTKTTIDWFSVLNQMGKVDRVFIVCPNRIMGTWVQEIHNHCPRLVNITVWDAAARKQPPPPVNGTFQLHIVITNYEAFATPGKKTKSGRRSKASGRFKTRAHLLKWIGDGSTAAFVLDESHKVKSPSGKAANMIVNLGAKFAYRVILTGTPVTKAKRVFDIYMQWKFLNPERFADLSTVGEFKAHYGKWVDVPASKEPGARMFPKFVGPRNLTELRSRMAKDAIIVKREDCFDLPPREDIVQYVDLKGSKSAYEQMARDMVALLEGGDVSEASIRLVQQLRLTQITSGFVTTDEGKIKRVGFEKSDALQEILEDQFEKEQKIVVAARWKPDLNLIEEMARLIGFKVWSIRGGVKRSESDAAILAFRDTDEPAIMVIQPAAASMGIDLSTASTMVWYSHTNSWVDFTQACDRIALSRSSTTFIHLVARHSVDEILMDVLANDGDVAKAIMKKPKELISGHRLDLDSSGRIDVKSSQDHSRKSGVL